jgi:hypothetical protein
MIRRRSMAIVGILALSLLTLAACGSAKIRTESHGYGSVYTQFGRD